MERTRPRGAGGWLRALGVAALVLGPALGSGCSSSSSPGGGLASRTVPSLSRSAVTSSTAATAQFGQAALAAYRGFRGAQVTAEAGADVHNADLARYSADKALADERATLTLLSRSGVAMRGAPKLDPKVTAVVAGEVPSVTITDCVDLSDWVPVYRATGKSAAAPNQLPRVSATAIVRPYAGSWRIMSISTDRSRPC